MTTGDITIRDLEQLLKSHGFTAGARLGNSRRYNHKPSGAMILLPIEAPERIVPVYVGNVRTHLDRFGVLDYEDFDEWMWRLKIARKDAAGKNGRPSANGHGSPAVKSKDGKGASGSPSRPVAVRRRPARRTPRAGAKGPA